MNANPLVSIVIPAYNPRFFAMALQSALGQSCTDLEVLVCDDSEGDEIESIVSAVEGESRARLRYVRNARRLGFVANLVQGVSLARGTLVKILCDDDRLFARCVELQAEALQGHAEVGLVLSQRVFCDENNFMLPMRLANTRFAVVDSLFKGEDMLALLDGRPVNFLGNFSAALMRRDQVVEWLTALTGEGAAFVALLDLALFACLMRRSNMIMLSEPGLIERLHPQRLSKQDQVIRGLPQEWRWLLQMLAARSGEPAPASGWVRYVTLDQAGQPRAWQELCLARVVSNWQTRLDGRIGSDCESYAELYQQWLAVRRFSDVQRALLPQTVATWPQQPRIVPVVLDLEGDALVLTRTLDSLAAQLYPVHACVVLGEHAPDTRLRLIQYPLQQQWAQQLNQVVASLGDTDWIYLLRAGDSVDEAAVLLLAERVAVFPGLACVYSDEGAWIEGEAGEPVFKPDFNLDLLRSYPYVGRTLAFAREAVLDMGGFDGHFAELAPHDLLWRLVEKRGPQVVEHIAEIQVQSALSFAQWLSLPEVIAQSEPVVAAHLTRLGVDHRIHHDHLAVLNRVEYVHQGSPLVSIIITTSCELADLQACVQSILEHGSSAGCELLLVADGQVGLDTLAWLRAMAELGAQSLQVVMLNGSHLRVQQIEAAAARARGEYLLLLDASLRVVQGNWLAELLQHARRPEVAIVGGKLVDSRERVVEAGRVLGVSSVAGRAFAGEDMHARGYLQRLQVVQNWSAVGGDCLMVRKAVFDELGGFGAQALGQGLAELDLCLRAGQLGYLVVGTPYSLLFKVDGCTSPAEFSQEQLIEQQQVFCERWLPKVARDPAYNPSLGLTLADFSIEPSLRGSWNPLCARALPAILGLPINDSAVGHYRVSEPFGQLESAGRAVGRIAYESPSIVQLARMDPDVIILQLRHSDDSVRDLERIARFSNARRVFEIDDYVLSAPKKNTHARNKPLDIEQHLRRGIGLCDRVVVTTQALANALSDMHGDIRVVPNMLAPHLWASLPPGRRGVSSKPRVGWGGGTSHSGDLEIIADVVRELAGEVEWVFFGMCPEALKPYIHEYHPGVSLQAYPAKLASLNLDLALAPLEFHIFNDCKSNLRLLEYGACGYPTICTDTEAYRGYLPCTRVYSNSTEEWLQAIRSHLSDPAASYRMGDELREAVMRDFVLREDNLRHWEWGWLAD